MLKESQGSAEKEQCFWILGGKEPTEADTSVFGFVVANLVSDSAPWSKSLLKRDFPVVVEYAMKIHQSYFPDYHMWD
jgi:hypothetical protein